MLIILDSILEVLLNGLSSLLHGIGAVLRMLGHINWVAISLCGLGISFLETVWFSSVLFRKEWQQGLRITDKDIDLVSRKWSYGTNFVLHLVLCFILAILVKGQGIHTFAEGALLGALLGGILGIIQALNYVYERRSWKLYFIIVGYPLIAFILITGLLAAWQ